MASLKKQVVLGPNNPQKKHHLHINPFDQGILRQRQLTINYDKLYDKYDLRVIERERRGDIQFAITSPVQYQTSSILPDPACKLCPGLCQRPQDDRIDGLSSIHERVDDWRHRKAHQSQQTPSSTDPIYSPSPMVSLEGAQSQKRSGDVQEDVSADPQMPVQMPPQQVFLTNLKQFFQRDRSKPKSPIDPVPVLREEMPERREYKRVKTASKRESLVSVPVFEEERNDYDVSGNRRISTPQIETPISSSNTQFMTCMSFEEEQSAMEASEVNKTRLSSTIE